MNRSLQPSELKEQLIKQLIVLAEEKSRFLGTYFPRPDKERADMDQFLNLYTHKVENYLASKQFETESLVLIGSKITIEYLDYQASDTFTIVFPEEADPDENRISFLSPVGRQLLLSKLNETLAIAAPAGSMQVRITNIEFEIDQKLAEDVVRNES